MNQRKVVVVRSILERVEHRLLKDYPTQFDEVFPEIDRDDERVLGVAFSKHCAEHGTKISKINHGEYMGKKVHSWGAAWARTCTGATAAARPRTVTNDLACSPNSN